MKLTQKEIDQMVENSKKILKEIDQEMTYSPLKSVCPHSETEKRINAMGSSCFDVCKQCGEIII